MENKKACIINEELNEMEIDYSLIDEKIKELNDMGVDITLQEVGDIIESKFTGEQTFADVKRWGDGSNKGRLFYPQYTLIRKTNKTINNV